MNYKLDERQQLITYKYGYHAFLITIAELTIFLLLNAGLEPNSSAIETALLKLLDPSTMLPLTLIPPFLYFYVRTTLSDGLPEAKRKQNIMYCPLAIIMYTVLPSNNPILKYSVVTFFIIAWIVPLYAYLKDKKKQNEIENED